MKDIRGAHVTAVRNAVCKKFRLQSPVGRRRSSQDASTWKKSKEVADSYRKLFTEEEAIDDIALSAFPSLETSSEEVYADWYIYIASVCDMILNPNYHSVITQKALELRLQKFRVFYLLDYFVILNI